MYEREIMSESLQCYYNFKTEEDNCQTIVDPVQGIFKYLVQLINKEKKKQGNQIINAILTHDGKFFWNDTKMGSEFGNQRGQIKGNFFDYMIGFSKLRLIGKVARIRGEQINDKIIIFKDPVNEKKMQFSYVIYSKKKKK